MDKILQPILQSPNLPDYVEELQRVLVEEEIKRKEFYEWLDEDKRAEFIAGEIVVHSPARLLHVIVLKRIAKLVDDFVEINKAGVVLTEQALVRLKRSDVMPDLAFWKNQAFENETKVFPVPDFIIEVLSKSTEQIDRKRKKEEYALNGITEYWIVDADLKTIEQYILDNKKYKLKEKLFHGTVQALVLHGLEIELSRIFG